MCASATGRVRIQMVAAASEANEKNGTRPIVMPAGRKARTVTATTTDASTSDTISPPVAMLPRRAALSLPPP